MNFNDFLTRADDEVLQEIVGRRAVRLLGILDPSLLMTSKLRQALQNLYTPQELLLNTKIRSFLLELLRPGEAQALAEELGIAPKPDVFAALTKAPLTSAAKVEKIFAFFDLAPTPPEEIAVRLPRTTVKATYALFPHQNVAARKVINYLYRDLRRVLLHMPTGSGKTRTAMHVIANHLNSRSGSIVVWLAHSEELCEQAASEFEKSWSSLGNRDTNVYRFWGSNEPDLSDVTDGFFVAGLSKIYNRAKQSISFISRLGNKASLVVMDEAHQAIAPTYQLILDALVLPFPNTALLGLSATPGRTWADVSADEKLGQFFARRKVTLQVQGYNNPLDYLVDQQYLAKVEYRSLMNQCGLRISEKDLEIIGEQLEIPQRVLDKLADDETRNLRIIVEIETLAKRHKRIIVFALSVEHSNLLACTLQVRGYDAKSVTGNTPSSVRQAIIAEYKSDDDTTKIICNYGVLTTGFDAPKTSAAVIARPTMSIVLYSQMVGRAIRGLKAGGNEKAEIVTVVDTALPAFRSVAEAFNNWEDVWEGVD